jgi:hypothetical protein
VFFAEVGAGGADGLEDPQPKQAEHDHQREAALVQRLQTVPKDRRPLRSGR